MFRQTDGVAMGSPLGPILANIFVGHHEILMAELGNMPMVYTRYVDDTFALFETKQQSVDFFQRLQQMHPALQFTCEPESGNKLPFLDVLIERTDDLQFETSVFRKKTFNGDYMSWNSFCPQQRKTSIISCLIQRAFNICSPSKLDAEITKITTMFKDLGYPIDVVRRTVKTSLPSADNAPKFGPKKDPVYMRLPYIGPVSGRFKQQLSDAVQNCYGAVKLRTIFSTTSLLSCRLKDRTPTPDSSNVVYQFTCCCDSKYVGRTSQRLGQRINQHVPKAVRKALTQSDNTSRKTLLKKSTSAIAQHLLENPKCGELFDMKQFTIIKRARTDFHLKVLESVYIQTLSPILCRRKEYVYNTILFKRQINPPCQK